MTNELFTVINGDRPDVVDVAICITDGNSTWERDQTIPQAVIAHNRNITTFSVGITDDIDVS